MARPCTWACATSSTKRLKTAAPFLVLLAGCRLGVPDPHWSDQVHPGGVCRTVNLADGLDDESTDELHALFACLNRTGNLEPLAELDAVMDVPTRMNEPIGLTVVRLSNRLPASGFDVFGLAGKALQLLQEEHGSAESIMQMTVEALYGRPYATVRDSVDLNSVTELDRGMIRPALPLVSALAQTVLDDGDAIPELAVSMLESDRVDDATCTIASLFDSDDAELSSVSERLLPTVGQALDATTNADNDLWTEATGDSLRDLSEALLLRSGPSSETSLEALQPALRALLADESLRDRLAVALALAEARGQLDHLPSQLAYLMDVDVDGYPVLPGGDSALHAGIRMLHRGNTTVVCTFLGTDIELFNFSQLVVEMLAEEGLGTITDLVGLLGRVLDLPLTDVLLQQIASGGYCPPIDEALIEDLRVLERFHDDEVQALLPMTTEFLSAVHPDRGTSRVPELLSLVSIAYERELILPAEEATRDLADTQLASDAMTLLPFIINPEALRVDACPDSSEPIDFETLWAIGQDSVSVGEDGRTPLQVFDPLLRVAIEHPSTWATLQSAAQLAQHDEAEVQDLPRLLVQGIDAIEDPSAARSMLVQLLDDETLRTPTLALMENSEIMDAAGNAGGDTEGPLPFVARLITSEAVTVMLQTVDMLLDSLGAKDEDSSS
jgi:hypothetical protein